MTVNEAYLRYESPWLYNYIGLGYIQGGPITIPASGVEKLTVFTANIPVYLLDRKTLICIDKRITDVNGGLLFSSLMNYPYLLYAKDSSNTYLDVCAGPLYPAFNYVIADPVADAVVTLPVHPVISAAVADSTNTWIPLAAYTIDKNAGTITYAHTLPSLSGFVSPYHALYSFLPP
jgi:hypothetical protein